MSDQPWNRLLRTGSVMDIDSSQPPPPVTHALAPLALVAAAQNADAMPRKRRRLDSPESEETGGDRRDLDHHPTQDRRWQGPSHPPTDASGYDSPTEANLQRLAITGPIASGEYYEKWPDTEADGDDGLGSTQPAQEPPSPTRTEVPLSGDDTGGTRISRVFKKPLGKEDTLMSIDFSQSQVGSTSRSDDAAFMEKFSTMFDGMRQAQRADIEAFADEIKAQMTVECADLKNEMTRLRAELVDLRIQYQRIQNSNGRQ